MIGINKRNEIIYIFHEMIITFYEFREKFRVILELIGINTFIISLVIKRVQNFF